MIVCRSCGSENQEGEQFCVSCGSFLEFSGEKLAEPTPVAPPRPRPAPPSAPTAASAPTPPPSAASPPPAASAPPEPPKSSKGRITFSAPRPSQSAAGATASNAGATTGSAPAPPQTNSAKAPPATPPPPPVRMPEGQEAPAAPVAPPTVAEPTDVTLVDEPTVDAVEEARKQREADERAKALVTRPTAVTPTVIRAGPSPVKPTVGTGAQPRIPEARKPSAQQPAVPKAKPPVKPPKEKAKQYRPGDLYCGKCGEGNESSRKFCRKCGESLAQAAVIEDPRWYKRIFKRKKKVYKAGERASDYHVMPGSTKKRKWWRYFKKGFRILVFLFGIVLLLGLAGPWRSKFSNAASTAYHKVKNVFIPAYVEIHPDGAEASSSLPDHPAALAIDGTTNLAWEEGVDGDGEQQKLIITFNRQTDIDRIGFRVGVSDEQEEFLAQPRPRQLHLQFSNGKGKDLTLKDKPDFQHFEVKGKAVVRVEITIINVNTSYKGGHNTGIAEVEFFRKS